MITGSMFPVFLGEVRGQVFTLPQCLCHQILTLSRRQGSSDMADPPLEFSVTFVLGSQEHLVLKDSWLDPSSAATACQFPIESKSQSCFVRSDPSDLRGKGQPRTGHPGRQSVPT